jgi:hypothetical protein
MKKFNDISRFKSEIVSYGSEISDINIRTEYLSDVMSIVSDSIELLKDSDVEDRIEARKIFLFNKYGKHIQSLRQEFRNKKLNQILNG